jgi:TetR/AcrR family transcriptional regulator
MEDERLPRRERQKLAQRQEMLAAALELFSKKGYRNVSMHEIAEKAEFAIGTLYKFFKNKEDLYKALILEKFYKFHEALTKAIEGPDDEIQKLRNYVRAKGEVFCANVSMIRLYFAETHGARYNVMAGFDSEIRKRRGEFMQTLASIFESAMQSKRFRRIADPYHLAVALDSITNAFLFLWLDEPERHPYPEDPDVVLDILFKGLLAQSVGSSFCQSNASVSI